MCNLQGSALFLIVTRRRERITNLTLQPIEVQILIFIFRSIGVRLRAHLKMAALGLVLTAFVTIKLRFKDTTNFRISNYVVSQHFCIDAKCKLIYVDTCTLHPKLWYRSIFQIGFLSLLSAT